MKPPNANGTLLLGVLGRYFLTLIVSEETECPLVHICGCQAALDSAACGPFGQVQVYEP